MSIDLISKDLRNKYEIIEWKNATAALRYDHPEEWDDLLYVLSNFKLLKEHILTPGGNKSPIARSINGMFGGRGWREMAFDIAIHVEYKAVQGRKKKVVDTASYEIPTHQVDYYKNRVAVETEWNNKDPFFDRLTKGG